MLAAPAAADMVYESCMARVLSEYNSCSAREERKRKDLASGDLTAHPNPYGCRTNKAQGESQCLAARQHRRDLEARRDLERQLERMKTETTD